MIGSASRHLLLCWCAIVALVLAPVEPFAPAAIDPGSAHAAPGRAETAGSKSKRAKKRKKRTRTKKKYKRAKKRRSKRAKKRRSKRTKKRRSKRRSNMPKGWDWPPTKAMRAEGTKCTDRLDELGVTWKKAPSTRKVANPIYVPDLTFGAISLAPTFRKGPFVMDCFLALALTVHSRAMYEAGVRVLRFSSIHQYRKAKSHGKRKRALSRHALGLAVDVYEITMDDGTTLIVEDDYQPADSRLRAVEDAVNATGGFRTLLSPKNDPKSHDDHFHFSTGLRLQ